MISGPFGGRIGLYAGMQPHARVEVLLALLGGERQVILPKANIEARPSATAIGRA